MRLLQTPPATKLFTPAFLESGEGAGESKLAEVEGAGAAMGGAGGPIAKGLGAGAGACFFDFFLPFLGFGLCLDGAGAAAFSGGEETGGSTAGGVGDGGSEVDEGVATGGANFGDGLGGEETGDWAGGATVGAGGFMGLAAGALLGMGLGVGADVGADAGAFEDVGDGEFGLGGATGANSAALGPAAGAIEVDVGEGAVANTKRTSSPSTPCIIPSHNIVHKK